MPNRPPSAFTLGQRVRVVSARHPTPPMGTIRDIVWHFSNERYGYYIEEGGKKIDRRYVEEDLEAIE